MSTQANIETLADYYAGLLAYQYRGLPRARKTIRLFAKQLMADLLFHKILDAFNLETASGEALDIIAKYVGVVRASGVAEDKPFFRFIDMATETAPYTDEHGFRDMRDASVNSDGIFYASGLTDAGRTLLSDTAFRQVIKMKIALNHFNGSFGGISDFIERFCPGSVYCVDHADDQNMFIEYGIAAHAPLGQGVIDAFLPRVAGCRVGINYVSITPSLEGLGLTWVQTPGGSGSATVTSSVTTLTLGGFVASPAPTVSWILQPASGVTPTVVSSGLSAHLSLTGDIGQQMGGSGYLYAKVLGHVRYSGNYMYFTSSKLPYTIRTQTS